MLFQYSNPIPMNLLISELCTYITLPQSVTLDYILCARWVLHTLSWNVCGSMHASSAFRFQCLWKKEFGICLFPLTQTVLHHQSYFPLRNRQVLGLVPHGAYIDGIVTIPLYSDINCCKIATMYLFLTKLQFYYTLVKGYSKVRLVQGMLWI